MEPPKTSKHEARSCLSKARYLKKSARRVAKSMRQRFGEKNIKAYNCQYCDYWHIGHARKPQ